MIMDVSPQFIQLFPQGRLTDTRRVVAEILLQLKSFSPPHVTRVAATEVFAEVFENGEGTSRFHKRKFIDGKFQ